MAVSLETGQQPLKKVFSTPFLCRGRILRRAHLVPEETEVVPARSRLLGGLVLVTQHQRTIEAEAQCAFCRHLDLFSSREDLRQ